MADARRGRWVPAIMLCLWMVGLSTETNGAQLTQTAPGLPNLRASAVAWGDVDNDGDLDLAIAGLDATGQVITKIYKNTAGVLTEDATQQLTGIFWGSMAWGDEDNDGRLDLAISGQGQSGNEVSEVYRNVDGVLTKDPAQLIGPPPFFETKQLRYSAVAWADYNNDGKLDLLIAGIDRNGFVTTKLYKNTNDILTEDLIQSIAAARNGSVAWGDFDGDGLPDLAIMGLNDQGLRTIKVYLNQSGTLIESPNIVLTPVYGGSVAWGDYDQDGNLDLAVSGWDEYWNAVLKVYHNNSLRGTLEEVVPPLQVGVKGLVGSMAWGDFDNDGDLDLAVSGRNEFTALSTAIFLNNGGTGFSLASEPALIGEMNGAIAWGDVNGDTKLDLLVTGEKDDGSLLTTLYTNSGTANTPPGAPTLTKPFVTSKGIVFRWTEGTDTQTPDASLTYNMRLGTTSGGNQLLSAAVSGSGANKGAGPGNIGRTLIKTLRFPVSVDTLYWGVQTVDGGFERSAFATEDMIIIQRLVNSEQQLVGLRQNILGQAAAWGDYNKDGWVDLIIGGQDINGDTKTLLYRNDIGALTQDNNSTLNGLENGPLIWGDYDRDGDLDLYQSGEDRFGNAFTYLYKNTSGTFQVDTNQKYDATHLSHLKEGGAAWGDYNNDGRLDLAASGLDRNGVRQTYIYKNVGPGDTLVVDTAQGVTGTANGALAWADIDNDGDLDLILCGESGLPNEFIPILKVYQNTAGILDSIQNLTGLFSTALAVGDYDNDGDPDFVVTGGDASFTPQANVYRNNGTGTFTVADTLTGTFGGSVAWGDYDNDGYLDLLLTGQDINSQVVTILYRNNAGTLTPTSLAVLPGSVFSAAAWADYDNDRDLDLALTGGTGTNFKEISQVFDNLTGRTKPNTTPNAPLSLTAQSSGNTVALTWNDGTDSEGLASSLTYSLRVGTGPGKHDIVSGLRPVGFGSQGHANVDTLRGLADSTYYWAIQTIDAGLAASAESSERQFIIDTTPPRIASVSVDPPIAGIGAVVTIVINFEERNEINNDVDPTVTFMPKSNPNLTVPVTQLSYTGRIWTGKVTIESSVPTDTVLIAVSGTKDKQGNVMVPVTDAGTFRVDTAIPAVLSTVPGVGALGVSASTTIKATFSKPLDPLSLTTDTFKMQRLDPSAAIQGTIGYDVANNAVLFTPSAKLDPDKEYEVIATAGIKDVVGNRLSADYRWKFKIAKVVSTGQGGRLQSETNNVSLYIPPNAFGSDQELSIEPLDSTTLVLPKPLSSGSPATLKFVGPAFRFKPVVDLKSTKPATLTMQTKLPLPNTIEETKVTIYRQDDTTPTTWVRIGGTVKTTENTTKDTITVIVTTVIAKLGTYALFEDTGTPSSTGAPLAEFRAQPRVLSPQGTSKGVDRFNTREASISFKLGQSMPVTIEVYNLAGRLERVLCRDKAMGPGNMVEVWDGKDDDKHVVKSGLYLILIDAGGHREKLPISVLND